MYKIFADKTLIYDSTIEDFKIGKGQITLETNKSGSFVFSIYPNHFYYDLFVKLKTVITVYKSNKIVFRGRILNDVTDYWNNKVITCEGELGFLQDSIIRPFSFTGTPEELFIKFVNEHNSQVDEFKRFKIGKVTVIDPNDYINRSNSNYETTINNLNSRLIEDSLGGYFYVTHENNGTEEIPTLNYLADFTHIAIQTIEFGANLKDYTKTIKAEEMGTAIIPLGHEISDETRLTIAEVNNDIDYLYDEKAVALFGWIFKVVTWDDVTDPDNLKTKALNYLETLVKQNITIELNAIDLHLLNRSIESFKLCDYIRAISPPHKLDLVLLCNKQTLDLLKPDNDTVTLGYTYSTFTETNSKMSSSISSIPIIQSNVRNINNKMIELNNTVNSTKNDADKALESYQEVNTELGQMSGDLEIIANVVTENARNIATNAENINKNALAIADQQTTIDDIMSRLEALENTEEETTEEGETTV